MGKQENAQKGLLEGLLEDEDFRHQYQENLVVEETLVQLEDHLARQQANKEETARRAAFLESLIKSHLNQQQMAQQEIAKRVAFLEGLLRWVFDPKSKITLEGLTEIAHTLDVDCTVDPKTVYIGPSEAG